MSPSTYSHYELDRVPPAELLIRAAKLTRASLEWLLTGEEPSTVSPQGAAPESELVTRIRRLLNDCPDFAPALTRYLEALEQAGPAPPPLPQVVAAGHSGLIPLVGSTAAGLARFWEEAAGLPEGPAVDAQLEEMLRGCDAEARMQGGLLSSSSESDGARTVALVQYAMPDARGILEFISAPAVKAAHPRGVAWRIDGDSMSPRYRDGDVVITSPDRPAVENHPCVARQQGQIGVNCKLFQRRGPDIILIPINERHPVQRFPESQLMWAWRVVCSVRL